ncbi:transcriptional regulator, TetR family [Sporobacter termitidis DSM 10068]|uniref:Transcriptional regulator, TetR family n=1 Tax=Sporobacter termitidis DSM 10068 TaxID=1123282 RepID=A0A1M5UHJ0_9FIRM|nr:TetR/AcrR family transcriptional regulator [Sporobacter termitidis]SHH62390.1 transcriptional regulator, TetR family [Sporobacter termitidis DSM 10068]
MPYKKSELTKELVYKAALELMEENGYRAATIRDICKRANVSVGTFYSYFNTKSDVIREIYFSGDKFFLESVTPELEGKTCYEQLRLFVRYYAQINIETGLDIVKVLFNPDNEWFRQTRPMQSVLEEIIRRGQSSSALRGTLDAARIVDFFFDLLRGICYTWCVYDGSFDLETRMAGSLDLILDGIQA